MQKRAHLVYLPYLLYLTNLIRLYDWSDSEILDSPKLGELRFRSKTKAGPLEDKQLSRAGNIALVR